MAICRARSIIIMIHIMIDILPHDTGWSFLHSHGQLKQTEVTEHQ
jgi:hypothetical protein